MKIEIKKLKMTKKVIKDIIEIDKEFYLDFDYSDTSWYFKRYSTKNKITVLLVNDKIVGYYLFYTISEKLLKEICDLKHSGDYDFDENEINVKTNINYICSVLVKKDFLKYAYHLILSLKKDIEEKDIVVAIAVSTNGHRMCEKYMKKIGSVNNSVDVYLKK